ncbi:MAG: EamA family transporter [Candidatus Saccharimonadales bacterium]
MSWIAYSFMMFISSVALYLTVRKSSLMNTPSYLTNLAMFAIPLFAYVFIGAFSHSSFAVAWLQILIIVITAVFFAYGGNKASLHAISVAPNPGYSLVLSKSYVLFTTIVAVALLGAELTAQKAIAILMIVAFSALVMVTKSDTKNVSSEKWIALSFGAFFAWGMLSLISKYLFSQGVETITFLIYLYAIVTICIIAIDKVKVSRIKDISTQAKVLLIGTGIFSTLFNLGQFEAIRLAPNVGYVNAINAGSIAVVTILAVLLFKDELTMRKAVGIFGVTLGLVLLLT